MHQQSAHVCPCAYSHEELMEQLENTNRDLHLTSERLRKVEAQRLAAVREAEGMRVQMQQMEVERKAQLAAAKQRCVFSHVLYWMWVQLQQMEVEHKPLGAAGGEMQR
eukprot:scaffold12130_cov21-Tisochrysis_lutea.AAC.1